MQEAGSAPYSIGRLAELSGLPVKTIRFYSDEGLIPGPERTEAGHRRYGDADVARLQLIRSLRDLGLDLPSIRGVLEGRGALSDVLAAHVRTLETQIRGLQRQLAVVRSAADSPTEATVRRVQQLAHLDAAERRQLLDHFWDRALEGAPDPAIADRFRRMGSPDLPEHPTEAQLDAWLELAAMASDEDFQETTRRNARWVPDAAAATFDVAAVNEAMARATAIAASASSAGEPPTGPEGDRAVEVLFSAYATALGRADTPAFRAWLHDQVEAHTDPRAARWWHLVGVVRGEEPSAEDLARISAGEWLWEAFRARRADQPA
jgi:DNA-binding transcriptional MerR regulator